MKRILVVALCLTFGGNAFAQKVGDAPTPPPPPPVETEVAPKKIAPALLSAEEVVAAKSALKHLRKLDAAVSTGLSRVSYSERVIDAKGEIDELVAELPDGELKIAILSSLQGYVDALQYWNNSIRWQYVSIILEAHASMLTQYDITINGKEFGEYARITWGPTFEKVVNTPLSKMWLFSNAKTEEAAAQVVALTPSKKAADDK